MSKALELAKFGREAAPTGLVVGDSDAQTLSSKTFSDGPVFSSGTANSLAYLNGSKALTADGALGYDGTTFSTSVSVNSQAASIYTRNTNTGTSAWAGLTIGNDISNNRSGILVTSSNRTVSGFVGPQSTYLYNSVGLMSIVTESNNPIYIGTNNTTRITINGSGNVGIGTDPSTGAKLQVTGYTDFWNSTNTLLRLQHDGTRGRLQAYTSGAVGNIGINSEGGNVGIGTDSPVRNFTVYAATNARMLIQNANYNGAINKGLDLVLQSTGEAQLWNYQNNYLAFGTNNQERVYISAAGKVGIGTSLPTEILTISHSDYQALGIYRNLDYNSVGAMGVRMYFGGYVGSTATASAAIDGTLMTATTGRLSLSNLIGGTLTESLRIDTAGNIQISAYSNTGGGKLDLTSNATAVIQARSTATGTGDGTADVTVTRAVTAGASWWANARYDAYSHTWGYGAGATVGTAMRITGAGNLGIGTTGNTTEKLNINGGIWLLGNDDANYSTIIAPRYDSNYPFTMRTRNNSGTMVEWLGIYADSGGANNRISLGSGGWNVGIGTTSPSAVLEVKMSRTSSTSGIALVLSDNVTGAQTDGVYKSIRSASNNGNSISEIRFIETDGTNNNTAIAFATQSTGGGLTERMRIGNNGVVSTSSGMITTSGQATTGTVTTDASGNATIGISGWSWGDYNSYRRNIFVMFGLQGGTYLGTWVGVLAHASSSGTILTVSATGSGGGGTITFGANGTYGTRWFQLSGGPASTTLTYTIRGVALTEEYRSNYGSF